MLFGIWAGQFNPSTPPPSLLLLLLLQPAPRANITSNEIRAILRMLTSRTERGDHGPRSRVPRVRRVTGVGCHDHDTGDRAGDRAARLAGLGRDNHPHEGGDDARIRRRRAVS